MERRCKDCKNYRVVDYSYAHEEYGCVILNAVGPCPETKEYYRRKF